ncbi:MAG: hypothetical protein V1743_07455 [Nanoarchaeota archaeon]
MAFEVEGMKTSSTLIISAFIFIALAMVSAAQEATKPSVLMYSPLDNTTSSAPTQEFVFSVEGPANAQNCSLVIDNAVVKTYIDVIRKVTRKFTASLTAGTHLWQVSCVMEEGEQVDSESRTVLIDTTAGSQVTCVDKVSKGSGTYRYVFTQGCIQAAPVTIKSIVRDDWIEYHMKQGGRVPGGFELKQDYIVFYLTMFSKDNNRNFITFKTSQDQANKNVFEGEYLELDVTGDSVNDLKFTYDKYEINKGTVTLSLLGVDYSQPGQNQSEEETVPSEDIIIPSDTGEEQGEGEETTTPQTGETGQDTETGPGQEPVQDEIIPEEELKTDPTKFWVTIILVIILIIIVIALSVKKKNAKPLEKRRQEKKDLKTGKKHVEKKSEQKGEQKKKEPELKDEPEEKEEPEQKPDFMIEAGEFKGGAVKRKR